ncbi:HEAT repeat domain-containing protein [Nocardiopsis valliformis]|uniref:HEAT repeat domain-containing protein n=1 Tax=Nocardiopsis valliformis TaxID=239974 RepID=UPI000476C053|nr:HEAT repeat domain-containing protein [Nocardiopsis valliformis]
MSPTAPTFRSAAELLVSLEGLSHHSRMVALADHARPSPSTTLNGHAGARSPSRPSPSTTLNGHAGARSPSHTGTPHLAVILRGLIETGHHREALHMAIIARDLDTVAGYLAGPDPELRGAALRAVRTLPIPDPMVLPVLEDAPTALRRALYRTLYQGRRSVLADALLERVRSEYGDAEAAALLPACTAETVARHLPGLAHAFQSWRRLARRHPDTLGDHLAELLAASATDRSALSRWHRPLTALDPIRPGRVLEIAGAHNVRGYPHARRVSGAAPLRSRHPEVSTGSRLNGELSRAMRTRPATARCVLRSMPPQERSAFLERVLERWNHRRTPGGLLPFLDLLPREQAAELAREALAELSVFQRTNSRIQIPDQDLDAIAHLPYTEAAGPLGEAASSGDPDRRARGLIRLVEATARTGDRELLAAVLTERVERHRADRDPVRRALLTTLTDIDPNLLVPCLPLLHRLLTDTVQARDTSATTRDVLRHLAARLLRHPDTRVHEPAVRWGIEVYRRLIERFGADGLGDPDRARHNAPWWAPRRRGNAPWWVFEEHGVHRHGPEPRLYQVLPPGAEDVLFGQLSGFLARARRRGVHALAVALAAELGRRGRHLTALDSHLRAAVLADPGSVTADRAAALHLAAHLDRTERARRALSLFEEDPATARVPRVWDLLARYHPPSVVLRALAVNGAGQGGQAENAPVWVPRVSRDLARSWPAELRERLRAHLLDVIGRPVFAAADREAALRSLSSLPGAHTHLPAFLNDGEVVLREAALSALGRCGRPETALELIAAHSGGPQSRAVGPALSRCAEHTRPSRLGPLLARVLEGPGKVTVRRTAARLLARHRPPGAIAALTRVLRRPDEHRDVLAAVATALLRRSDAPAALAALTERVPDFAEEEIQVALLGVDPEGLAPALRRPAAETLAGLPVPRRSHWRMSGWWARWNVWGSQTLDDVVEAACDLDQPTERAMSVFVQTLVRGRGRDRLAEVLERLLAQLPGPESGVPVPSPAPARPPHWRSTEHDRASGAFQRLRRVLDLLHSLMLHAPAGDQVIREQTDRVRALLATRPELLDGTVTLMERDLARTVRVAEDDPDIEAVLDHLFLAALLLTTRPNHDQSRFNAIVSPLCSNYRRPEVPMTTLVEVVRRLAAAAEADSGPLGCQTGLLGLTLLGNVLRGTGWEHPLPDLLTEAGRSRHEEIRLTSWNLVLA